MFMRQILADAISKFQKITRQMLCDKCSENDVTLIPPANVIWREHYANPQNADVTSAAGWGLINYLRTYGRSGLRRFCPQCGGTRCQTISEFLIILTGLKGF
jgi:hypothetical protein